MPKGMKGFQKGNTLGRLTYGSKVPSWKGDKVGYCGIHEWIRRRYLKPELCECCKKKPPYDLANKSGKYKRDLDDWEWLCRRCHMTKDGRLENFKKNRFDSTGRRKNKEGVWT